MSRFVENFSPNKSKSEHPQISLLSFECLFLPNQITFVSSVLILAQIEIEKFPMYLMQLLVKIMTHLKEG